MSELTISAVPVNLVEFVYPKAVPHLERVIDKAPLDINLTSIKEKLLTGASMLVVILDGEEVIAVNILESSIFETGHKVLYIPITGGDRMDEWLDRFMSLAHAIARDLKCNEIRGMSCRKGWLKALKDHDWYHVHEVIGCKVKQLKEVSS